MTDIRRLNRDLRARSLEDCPALLAARARLLLATKFPEKAWAWLDERLDRGVEILVSYHQLLARVATRASNWW